MAEVIYYGGVKMAKFNYSCDEKTAILSVKKALNGKVGILKDKGSELVVGAPMMTVNIVFNNGTVETKASLFGKALLGTVDSCIELSGEFIKI